MGPAPHLIERSSGYLMQVKISDATCTLRIALVSGSSLCGAQLRCRPSIVSDP